MSIEEIVETWPDAERHAFWDLVDVQVAEERVDPESAIQRAFDFAAFQVMHDY